MFEEVLQAWDGEEVVLRFDDASATWMFVCVHSTVLGPAAGGTRMKVYASPSDALRDGLRLSTAMTSKMAMAGVPLGGGKAVLAVPEIPVGDARRTMMLRYGELVESLHGTYWTACDMNTASSDMDVIAERTSKVFGRTEAAGGSGTSAPATAVGVFHGLRAAVARAFGSDDLTGRTVAVQGVGAVGGPLARALAEAGARLTLADVDDVRAKELADELGCDAVRRTRSWMCGATSSRRARPAPCCTRPRSRVCGAASSPAPPTTSSPNPRTPIVWPNAASCTRRTTSSTPVG